MVRDNECPECGRYSIKFDPVGNIAYCERMMCNFSERIEGKLDFKEKYGTFKKEEVV